MADYPIDYEHAPWFAWDENGETQWGPDEEHEFMHRIGRRHTTRLERRSRRWTNHLWSLEEDINYLYDEVPLNDDICSRYWFRWHVFNFLHIAHD